MREKLTKTNQSIEKALQIIEVLAHQQGSMRLQDISREADIPAPTAMRLLNALARYNYVIQSDENFKYSLTLKFAQIGNLVKSQFSITDVARPYLITLSKRCNESVCLAIEQDMEVVYIESIDGPDHMLRAMQKIGRRAPMHSTGVGKLLLLNYDDNQIKRYIEKKGLFQLTKNTIHSKKALLQALEEVKNNKYAVDDEECEIGARCVAAPIRDYSGSVIAAISVSGPTTRMTKEKISSLKRAILETTDDISKLFAYSN